MKQAVAPGWQGNGVDPFSSRLYSSSTAEDRRHTAHPPAGPDLHITPQPGPATPDNNIGHEHGSHTYPHSWPGPGFTVAWPTPSTTTGMDEQQEGSDSSPDLLNVAFGSVDQGSTPSQVGRPAESMPVVLMQRRCWLLVLRVA